MGANAVSHLQTQRDVTRMSALVNDFQPDPVGRWQTLQNSLTEEVAGSNPVRPTRHFLFLALPGSAPWPYNWP